MIDTLGVNENAGAAHYIESGRFEGRTVSFNPYQYLANYADLQAAFGSNTEAATLHYITAGYYEGRNDDPVLGDDGAGLRDYWR